MAATATNRDATDFYLAHDSNFSAGSMVTLDSTKSWTGWDSDYDEQTMTFGLKGTAVSEYGQLKTSLDAKVTNPYYNYDNPYYYDGTNSGIDESGSPDSLLGFSTAGFTDVLQYSGTGLQSGYKAKYVFFVHGSSTGSNLSASLNVTIGNNPVAFLDLDLTPGTVAQYWSTPSYTIDTSLTQTAKVSFTTRFESELWNESEGSTLAGMADFSSTITLTAIEVYDLNGNLVSNVGVVGSSGHVYAVPEPASFAALGVGLAALLRRRRKAS